VRPNQGTGSGIPVVPDGGTHVGGLAWFASTSTRAVSDAATAAPEAGTRV
jgi:hypothetical protein